MTTRTTPRRATAVLLLSAVVFALVRLVSPSAPPVYDGLPVPAERYRYLDPPPGVHNPGPPLSAHVTIQLVGGGNSPIDLPTAEVPPQAELELFHGDVNGNVPGVPAVTTADVTITAVPVPSVAAPQGRQLHGNVYRLRVVAAGRALTFHDGDHARVSLRQPRTSNADPRIAVLDGGHWRLLETHNAIGPGVLVATLPALGDVAIMEETSGFLPSHSHSGPIAGIAFAVFAAAVLLLVRVARSRRRGRNRAGAEDQLIRL